MGGNIILFDVDEARKVGKSEGRLEGKLEGKIIALYECVRDGIFNLQEAADRAGMNEADFLAGISAAGYELPRKLRP